MFFTKCHFFKKKFSKILLCGSLRISLSTDRNAGRGKVAYSRIFPDPTKAGPTLGGVVVVVVFMVVLQLYSLYDCFLTP